MSYSSIFSKVRRRLYHEYAESPDYTVPDVVCVFNCGFHEFISENEKVVILVIY